MKKLFYAGFLTLLLVFSHSVMAVPYSGADIMLLGDEYSSIEGLVDNGAAKTWFDLDGSIYTAWGNNWVEYTAYLTAGNWNIGLNAINHSSLSLSPTYAFFRVGTNWTSTDLKIPASDNEVNYAFFNRNISEDGLYAIRYNWENDSYTKGKYDANIEITSAFFDNTQTAPVPEPATLFLLGSGLLGISGLRKKKLKQ